MSSEEEEVEGYVRVMVEELRREVLERNRKNRRKGRGNAGKRKL